MTVLKCVTPKGQHVRLLPVLSASEEKLTSLFTYVNGQWVGLGAMWRLTSTLSEFCSVFDMQYLKMVTSNQPMTCECLLLVTNSQRVTVETNSYKSSQCANLSPKWASQKAAICNSNPHDSILNSRGDPKVLKDRFCYLSDRARVAVCF